MKTTLTVVLTILITFCQGECPIECYCDQVTKCTGDRILTRFPNLHTSGDTTPIFTSRLEMHDYAVKYLSYSEFLDIISNLTELYLPRNSLEEFDNETFAFTSLTSTSPTFYTGGIDSRFSSSHKTLNLRILDLSQNKLSYFVGGGKLSKLKILDLSSNGLQQVYDLNAMESLESVNLRDNRISYLQANIFQNLRNLQYVNLDSNVLTYLHPSTFSNLISLAHLILSSNPISNLLPGFYWNSRVQFVDVSRVGLTSIPTSLTKTVRDFRCANNNLTIIRQTDFESYPNVGLLVLDENAIETVEDDAFGRLEFLSRLWINGNRLTRVPQNLPPSLRSLQLEDNHIVNLSSSDFRNLRNLGELNLHSNRISSLPPSVFSDLTSLKSLDLRSNQIDVIYRDSFANLSRLESLDISQNPIKVIVTGAFGNLRKVSLLHLSRLMESIDFDKGDFAPLQNLQILELSDSAHLAKSLIVDSALTALPSLHELNLQRCELEDVNLVSNALLELNLQVVKMSGNPWDCQDLDGSAFHELMSKRTVVDEPICAQPKQLQGTKVAAVNSARVATLSTYNSSSTKTTHPDSGLHKLTSTSTITPKTVAPAPTSTTPPLPSHYTPSSLDKVTNAPNTNSPEKLTYASTPTTTHNPSIVPTVRITKNTHSGTSNSNTTNSTSTLANTNNVTTTTTPAVYTSSATLASKLPQQNTFKVGSVGEAGRKNDDSYRTTNNGDAEAAPTQSYFDNPTWKSRAQRANNISLSSSGGKKSVIPMAIGRVGRPTTTTTRPSRTQTLDRRKTNDDNAIIDESRQKGSSSREQETGEVQRSIDRSLPAQQDDGLLPTDSLSNSPKTSYLKSIQSQLRRGDSGTSYDSTSGTIIVKTLIISAATCLGSIMILLTLSFLVYRFSRRRRGIFHCSMNKGDGQLEQEDDRLNSNGHGMAYTRFGDRETSSSGSDRGCSISSCSSSSCSGSSSNRKSRKKDPYHQQKHRHHQHRHDFDSDSDQVELSGITNRLYFENEDIYHIT